MKETGQENFILSRMSYKKYVKSMLLSHSLYIFSIVAISIIIVLILGFIATGRFSGDTSLGLYDINFLGFIGIVVFQMILITIFAILVNAISALLNIWIHNKIVIQTLPFTLFTLAPMLISSTIGNIYIRFGILVTYFVPFKGLKGLLDMVQSDSTFLDVINTFLPIICYSILFIILYKLNTKKYTENCV